MMTKFELRCWSDVWQVEADLAQASATVYVDGAATQYQTADFRHSRERMRVELAQHLYADTPDHGADFDSVAELKEISEPEPEEYTLVSTHSGYAVRRSNGEVAEFCDSEEAEEAKTLIESGEKDESDYEWREHAEAE
jgi:hypothetical protein